MTTTEPQILEVAPGLHSRRIAALATPPAVPGGMGLMWLTGLKSDMTSSKATALAQWASARGLGMIRFDYSGHGRSSGRFEEALVSHWLEEAEAVLAHYSRGPQILVGSSTGGHIALLLLRHLMQARPRAAAQIRALVLIAPAWDLTEELIWKEMPEAARRDLIETGRWPMPSEHDPAGHIVITRAFIEDGRRHLLGRHPFDPGRPIHILQGQLDKDVPPQHARDLAGLITGGWANLTEVADGDHRLARPQDLELLFSIIEVLAHQQAG